MKPKWKCMLLMKGLLILLLTKALEIFHLPLRIPNDNIKSCNEQKYYVCAVDNHQQEVKRWQRKEETKKNYSYDQKSTFAQDC